MNFYGTQSRDEHTIAGRLIPLAEGWYRAVMKASGKPVGEEKYSGQLPAWCHKICDELTKTVFRNFVSCAPQEKQFDARSFGRVVGMLLRTGIFLVKELPAKVKQEGLLDLSKENEAKLETFAGLPLLLSAAAEKFQKPILDEDGLLKAGKEHVAEKGKELIHGGLMVLRYLINRPMEEQYDFLCGIPEGFVMFLNNQGDLTGKRNRFEMFGLLMMHWPEIVEMQKERPAKTRRDLLDWLERQEGRPLVEDPKQFYELCGDIDLNLAPPGHPTRSETAITD